MTTAIAFSALVWLLSFAVTLYYLVRLQEWRLGVAAAGVVVIALGVLATFSGASPSEDTLGGVPLAELTAVVLSVITLFAVFVFATTLQRTGRLLAAPSIIHHDADIQQDPMLAAPLIESELQQFIDAAPDALITINENGIVERASHAVQGILGYTPEELIGQNISVLMTEPDAREHDGYLAAYRNSGVSKILGAGPRDVTGRTKGGSAVPLELSISEMRGVGRRLFVGALRDMSKRIESQRQIEEQFSKTFHLNPNSMAITRVEDGEILEVNDSTLSLLGYTREEYVGRPADYIWEAPDERESFLQELRKTGLVENFEFKFLDGHGNRHAGLLSGCFIEFGGTEAILSTTRDVTRQKGVEESLRQSEEKFSKAFLMSPDSLIILRASDGVTLEINDQFLQLTGYAREDVMGVPSADLPWIKPGARDALQMALVEKGELNDVETEFQTKDGVSRTVLVSGRYIDLGEEKCFLSIVRDVTDEKSAEEALRQSEENFAAAFHTSPNSTVISSFSDGKILAANERCREVFGYGPDELKSMKATDVWAEPERRQELLAQIREKGSVDDFDYTFLGRGGGRRRGIISACLIEFGGTEALLSTARDVTDQKEAEESLQQSEEKFSKAFLMSPDSLVILRASDGVTIEINERFLQLTGRMRDEVVGVASTELRSWVIPDDRETLRSELEKHGELNNLETIFRTKTGKHIAVLISARYIHLDGEKCILSIVRDVSESRRAERELAQNREMLQALLDAVPLGINVKNASHRYTFMNPFQARVYGTTPSAAIGQTPADLVDAEYEASIEKHDRQVLKTGNALAYFEESTKNAQGETRNWLTTKLLLGEHGSPDAQVLSISLDMTDRKATEDQLRHAQRMETVGHLTGGIAHDFNNLLTAMLGSLQLLSDRSAGDELAKRYLDICLRAVNRGADLTQRLLAFSRKQALNPRATDINSLVNGMKELLQRTLGSPVEIRTETAQALWPAMVDEAQLESAILNLAINARDAMPAGGRLSIKTTNVELEGQTVDDETIQAGSYVQISVTDSGAGIPAEVLGRVFEPFFTTKDIGKGSGLGLSMVYGFVKQSGGHVEIESAVAQGTTIRLYLPRAEALLDTATVRAENLSKLQGDESILVVEDDPDVRAFDVVVLERLGYTVRSANDGIAALAIADGLLDLDLLLTDVLLPGGMSGKAIADKVVKLSPETKVLFVSGFSEPAVGHDYASGNGAELLSKPYSRDDLARKVREVLDGSAPATTSADSSPS